MSLKVDRFLEKHKFEFGITTLLFILALILILLSLPKQDAESVQKFIGQLGLSLLVAIIVRWLSVIFSEVETSTGSDKSEYYEAIRTARNRIWIYQTWLPGVEGDAHGIISSRASDKRLLLLSFQPSSPIYGRMRGRRMGESTGKHNSAASAKPFVENKLTNCVRFNVAHHPAWIAVIDSFVFWGPTPIDKDALAENFLIHKHPISSQEGRYWIDQFNLLWDKHSHDFDEEKKYNQELKGLQP
jgi:hypothetical protein